MLQTIRQSFRMPIFFDEFICGLELARLLLHRSLVVHLIERLTWNQKVIVDQVDGDDVYAELRADFQADLSKPQLKRCS